MISQHKKQDHGRQDQSKGTTKAGKDSCELVTTGLEIKVQQVEEGGQ
jgi:hypothetical protein